MYKLLIVDDEERVRKGIIKTIEWEKFGFQIVGEAENGKEALEIVEKVVPDVVITDIKMPFMDGLELSELIKEKYPHTKIIILTGFDEFEYAQKSVKLDVLEYILKPISADELSKLLEKLRSEMDEEFARKKDMQALKEYYRKSLPVLREKFLASLIMNKMKKSEILEKANNYNLDFHDRIFIVSVISIDAGIKAEDRELFNFAVLNISEEIFNKHELGIVFLNNDYTILFSFSDKDDKDNIIGETLSALEEIRRSIETYLEFTVTIGVGTLCDGIEFISYSYKNAVSALDYRLVLGNNRIICINDLEPHCSKKLIFDDVREHALVSSLKVGSEDEISGVIDSLFEEIINSKASIKDYQIYLLEMLTAILKTAEDLNVNRDNIFGSVNLFVELHSFNDIFNVKSWITRICTRIMSSISKERQDTNKLLVKKVKDYVREHFHECNITIDKVCKLFHISPTYFSYIFKRETKVTFINYLIQIRMEAAKELLRTSDMRSFEIAGRVGYSDPNYFSFCFKKNFEVSPTEYRNSFNRHNTR